MTIYLWVKALHIISVISWMAGMLYLPRLYAYHCTVAPGSEASSMLKVMEKRLLRIIINPAMIAALVFGIWLIAIVGFDYFATQGWLHAKLGLVLVMMGFHGKLARWRKDFENNANTHSTRFYKLVNEVPALLMVIIVLLAVLKPF